MATDVNALFARAEGAFRAERMDAARADLIAIARTVGEHPAVLHLLGLVEKKRGALADARRALERAAALAPNDPQIANNLGNLLGDMGETEAALAAYGRALAARPDFHEARLNRGITLTGLGRTEAARADLSGFTSARRDDVRGWNALGALEQDAGDFAAAADALDRALALQPAHVPALHHRARIALERGEADAAERHRSAIAAGGDSFALAIGLAHALEMEGHPGAIPLLTAATRAEPGWADGHEALAQMRAEAGEAEAFADHYLAALAARPGDRALHLSYWRTLGSASRHADALAAMDKAGLAHDRTTRLMEAMFASEAGLSDRADAAFAMLPRDADLLAAVGRGRHHLRRGDPGGAEEILREVVARDPGNIVAWAHLDLAWRLLNDPRHAWLAEQPGLVGVIDLGVPSDELSVLADHLRQLHRARAHPIGQSLRSGTQTRGTLFARTDPIFQDLASRMRRGVEVYMGGLPPFDADHPLLRHRDERVRFAGSWSVRLGSGGFHINHVHPQGILSSACYIALPEEICADRAGWLELGGPPVELGLDLPALRAIQPKAGRLVLFPSYLYHGTRPFTGGERLTVAFDVTTA